MVGVDDMLECEEELGAAKGGSRDQQAGESMLKETSVQGCQMDQSCFEIQKEAPVVEGLQRSEHEDFQREVEEQQQALDN